MKSINPQEATQRQETTSQPQHPSPPNPDLNPSLSIDAPTDPIGSSSFADTSSEGQESIGKVMRVKKRDGSFEPVNVNKIINVVLACSTGLPEVDYMKVAT